MQVPDSLRYGKYLGLKLTKDIISDTGLLLVRAGTVLDAKHLRIIEDHGGELKHTDVRQENQVPSVQEQNTLLLHRTTLKVQEYFDEIRVSQKVRIDDIRQHVLPHIYEAAEHPHLFGLLSNLQARDDYTYRHNLGVGVLSALLGKWLGLSEAEVSELTMAATLHDVGKMMIPLEVLNKPGKLTAEEFTLIKKHTVYGYEMLTKTEGSTPIEAIVALQHHEREDGSGYPRGIRSDGIHFYSKIVAVADVYHAMSSRRSYHEPAPFYAILSQMYHNGFGEFDPRIVHVFIDKMMQMAVGNDVLLTGNLRGTIVLVHQSEPLRPLVKVDDQFIDLRSAKMLEIQQVIG